MDIGLKIKELRSLKKVTQEDLANAVGISTQAVSKWENGGTPDINLLPQIADYFEITIDELFNRKSNNYQNIEQTFSNYISNIEYKDRFMKVFEMCWNLEKSMMADHNVNDNTVKKFLEIEEGTNSKMISEYGYSLMRIHKDNMFFYIAPTPRSGYFNKIIETESEQLEFLKFISSKDVYDTLVVLNKRANTFFTVNYLVGIGITEERASKVIDGLLRYGFLTENHIQIDSQNKKIYVYKNTPALIILFTALDLIVKREDYWCYCTDSDKQYFKIDK